MFDKFESRLSLKGEVETLTAIRIGAGRSNSPVGADLPVVRDVANFPYIPGSSFKGVLRPMLKVSFAVSKTMRMLSATQPITKNSASQRMIWKHFGRNAANKTGVTNNSAEKS